MKNCIIVTGAAGFIGSNFVLNLVNKPNGKAKFVSLDKLTYAGNFENLRPILNHKNHKFVKGDINDEKILEVIFNREKPRAIINFAAESHVDRSIKGPAKFIQTNIFGTYKLLEQTRKYYKK